jgi:hypothetical protein
MCLSIFIGQLDSAVSMDDKTGKKNFQLKDETGIIQCSFFEIVSIK